MATACRTSSTAASAIRGSSNPALRPPTAAPCAFDPAPTSRSSRPTWARLSAAASAVRRSASGISTRTGFADYAYNAYGDNGGAGNYVSIRSGFDQSEIRRHLPAPGRDYLGMVAVLLGDVDGDGIDDYALGNPFSDGSALTAFDAYLEVFSGATGLLIHDLDYTSYGAGFADNFGWAASNVGDLNGDGLRRLRSLDPARRRRRRDRLRPRAGSLRRGCHGPEDPERRLRRRGLRRGSLRHRRCQRRRRDRSRRQLAQRDDAAARSRPRSSSSLSRTSSSARRRTSSR